MSDKPKVLLIGWDAADWKVIKPLMEAGQMPALAKMVECGVMGDMQTLHPCFSPMLWTSIATGKRAYDHGIYGFSEPDPAGKQVRPVTNLSRKCKAVWNILNQNNFRSLVVGWWPSHPAEPINGVMVSDQFHKSPRNIEAPWPMKKGTVFPETFSEELAEMRVHPMELFQEQLTFFTPSIRTLDPNKEPKLRGLSRTIAEAASIQAASTHLLETEPWDFAAIYFDAIDHFSHGFMRFHPPHREWVNKKQFELYQHVINSAYMYHDMMLSRLFSLVDLNKTTILLLSDHGFHSDHLRPRVLPKEPAGPAAEHRDLGIFAAMGPEIKRDELVHGANLLDITPTILTLFGLPVGEDMDGQPLLDIFHKDREIETIPSWENLQGKDGRHPPGQELDEDESQEALDQLVALGYIDELPDDKGEAVSRTARELDYNLARSLVDGGRIEDARDLFQKLWEKWPDEHRFGVRLAHCLQQLGKTSQQRQVVECLIERRDQQRKIATQELRSFHNKIVLRAEKNKHRLEEKTRNNIARLASSGTADVEKVSAEILERLSPTEKEIQELKMDETRTGFTDNDRLSAKQDKEGKLTLRNLVSPAELRRYSLIRGLALNDPYMMHYLLGTALFHEGEYGKALQELQKAKKAMPEYTHLHTLIGQTYEAMSLLLDATVSYKQALKKNPHDADALFGLARVALNRNKSKLSIARARQALVCRHHFPAAHNLLGIALLRENRIKRARLSFQTAVKQDPAHLQSHRQLEKLYAERLNDPQQAKFHTQCIKEINQLQKKYHLENSDKPLSLANKIKFNISEIADDPKTHAKREALRKQKPSKITVVSGLPRSGTSMMMQMLSAAGHPILADDHRPADEDNPRGYLEYERAKSLAQDREWIPKAEGRAVKLVAQLLHYLPPHPHKYSVIFMHRPISEVIASQQVMLERLGKKVTKLPPERLAELYSSQIKHIIKWAKEARHISLLELNYDDVLHDPKKTADQLCVFLGKDDLDLTSAISVVDPTLKRQTSSRG